MARFGIDLDDGSPLGQALEEISDILTRRRFAQLMRRIGELMVRQTRQRFDTETDPDGVRWARRRSTFDSARPVLTLTGRLRRSIRFEATEDSVDIGTDVPYGRYHQDGTRDLPRRSFLGISPRDERQIRDLVEEFFEEIFES